MGVCCERDFFFFCYFTLEKKKRIHADIYLCQNKKTPVFTAFHPPLVCLSTIHSRARGQKNISKIIIRLDEKNCRFCNKKIKKNTHNNNACINCIFFPCSRSQTNIIYNEFFFNYFLSKFTVCFSIENKQKFKHFLLLVN